MGVEIMLSSQEEQIERRRVLLQDASVREASTLHQHGIAQANDLAGGRFAAVNNAYVVGSTPQVNYPAAGPHQADPVGQEPPLSYRIDDLLEPTASAQGNSGEPTSDAAPSPPPGDVERRDVGSSFSSGDPGDGVISQPSKHAPERAPGPLPYRRF
jgi:hypothetical protein